MTIAEEIAEVLKGPTPLERVPLLASLMSVECTVETESNSVHGGAVITTQYGVVLAGTLFYAVASDPGWNTGFIVYHTANFVSPRPVRFTWDLYNKARMV